MLCRREGEVRGEVGWSFVSTIRSTILRKRSATVTELETNSNYTMLC